MCVFDEGEKREYVCVKCQLSALFLPHSLYVIANERNPTCHSVGYKRQRRRRKKKRTTIEVKERERE
jgi:hypothetical protein